MGLAGPIVDSRPFVTLHSGAVSARLTSEDFGLFGGLMITIIVIGIAVFVVFLVVRAAKRSGEFVVPDEMFAPVAPPSQTSRTERIVGKARTDDGAYDVSWDRASFAVKARFNGRWVYCGKATIDEEEALLVATQHIYSIE